MAKDDVLCENVKCALKKLERPKIMRKVRKEKQRKENDQSSKANVEPRPFH